MSSDWNPPHYCQFYHIILCLEKDSWINKKTIICSEFLKMLTLLYSGVRTSTILSSWIIHWVNLSSLLCFDDGKFRRDRRVGGGPVPFLHFGIFRNLNSGFLTKSKTLFVLEAVDERTLWLRKPNTTVTSAQWSLNIKQMVLNTS